MKHCRSPRTRTNKFIVVNEDESILVPLTDVRESFGVVPEDFTVCFLCKEPAEFILCPTIDFSEHPILARHAQTGIQFPNADSNSLALALRAEHGSNLELPLCEPHSHGSITN